MTTPLCRLPSITATHPTPDFARILHKGQSAESTLSINVDGKDYMFKLNRRQLMGIVSSGVEALREMEPGQ